MKKRDFFDCFLLQILLTTPRVNILCLFWIFFYIKEMALREIIASEEPTEETVGLQVTHNML